MAEILSSIAVRDKKQVLILRTWKRTVISELRFMPSFWGHEYRYQSDKMSLWIIHSSGASTQLKSQILRLCSQRIGAARVENFSGSFWSTDFFPFSFLLCPKSLKDRFLRPEFTKSSLKKVAKNGKIEASQKKEVLRWRQRNRQRKRFSNSVSTARNGYRVKQEPFDADIACGKNSYLHLFIRCCTRGTGKNACPFSIGTILKNTDVLFRT